MHARRRGKAGSTKPIAKTPPAWITYKAEEVESLVVKLAKQGSNSSMIGLILRDGYGIPDVKKITKKTITQIIAEKGLAPDLPEDFMNLIKRIVQIKKHLKLHKKDNVSKRGLHLAESKLLRLLKYYKRNGKIPEDWKYNPKNVELLVE